MKSSELRKIYIAAVRLYGILLSHHIFDILDLYQIDYDKKFILNDLKARAYKKTNCYAIYKTTTGDYLIANDTDNIDTIDIMSEQKKGKPIYYPKTYEEFLKYSDYNYHDKYELEAIENISRFLCTKFDDDRQRIEGVSLMLVCRLKEQMVSEGLNFLKRYGYTFENERDIEKFYKVVNRYANNLRTPINNGFTTNEILKINENIDMDDVNLSISPKMKKDMLDGVLDPFDYFQKVEKSNMPLITKQNLKIELLKIMREVINNDLKRNSL